MTRWDMLRDVVLSHEMRKAVGKGWPLFFFLVFNTTKSNKLKTNYNELKEKLNESPRTLQNWRDHLVEQKVVDVSKGSTSMTFSLIAPYDSLITCEQDDVTRVKMNSDPATKKMLDKLSSYNNMSLLPLVAELSSKIDKLEKKLD